MTHVVLVLVGLAVLAPLPAVAVALVAALAAAGAVRWFVWCVSWPAVWSPPAGWSGRYA